MMKRIVSMIVAVVAVSFLYVAPAQAGLRYGIKGGLNLATVTFSKADLNTSNRLGYFIGPMAEVSIPLVGLGVDAAALFSETGTSIKTENGLSASIKSVSVPLNLKMSFGISDLVGIYLGAGPQFDFNVSDENLGDGFKLERYNTSVNVGAGVKYANHWQAGLNYNFSITKVAEAKDADAHMNQNLWQVSVAYLF